MDHIEFQWLHDEGSRKEALQSLLACSGQLLKKFYSSSELQKSIRAKDTLKLPLDLVNHLKINPIYDGPEVKILHETSDYLAVHKPDEIHVHPLKYSDTNTVLNFLAREGKFEALKINLENYDRGLIYRLDFETSGILILAKTASFHSQMRHNFQSEMKRKLYLTVVEGDFNQEGNWTHYFKASMAKGSKQKVLDVEVNDCQKGSLSVKKIMCVKNKSLLLVELKTGLRHQIRAQLAHLGFPILGDELYGGSKSERLFLHAWRYEWSESVEDNGPELFGLFFDLNSAFKMCHDVLGIFKSR
jgi:23S rRNA pseudouridine1911/1915/1917 synthase